MFYYAFGSWRNKPHLKDNEFTLYKNSSLIAFYILIIHSLLLETIALYWWLHTKLPILSIILLILNIYSFIFLLGNLQAIRHNPIKFTSDNLYLSFGLTKRMKLSWTNIEAIIDNPIELQHKISENTIEFIARDFEKVYPQIVLKLKKPEKATLLFGLKKKYKYVAIRVDEPVKFKNEITKQLIHLSE